MYCDMIHGNPDYNKDIVPSPINGDNTLKVNLSITIVDLLEIDVVGGSIGVKFQTTRDWFDARVTYQNLKVESSFNMLSKDDQNIMWFPHQTYNNIRSKASYEITDVETTWKVMANENYDFKVITFFI